MTTIIDILDELEKVSLEPLLIPVLKASDPLMGSLPKGSLKPGQDGRRHGTIISRFD
jgi:hypothetical protein